MTSTQKNILTVGAILVVVIFSCLAVAAVGGVYYFSRGQGVSAVSAAPTPTVKLVNFANKSEDGAEAEVAANSPTATPTSVPTATPVPLPTETSTPAVPTATPQTTFQIGEPVQIGDWEFMVTSPPKTMTFIDFAGGVESKGIFLMVPIRVSNVSDSSQSFRAGETDIQLMGSKSKRYSIASDATLSWRLESDLSDFETSYHPGTSIDTEIVFDADQDESDLKLALWGTKMIDLGVANVADVSPPANDTSPVTDAPAPAPAEPRPEPRTDLRACYDVWMNEANLGEYVQWGGVVMNIVSEREIFQVNLDEVEWDDPCNDTIIVMYDGKDRVFKDDIVVFTGEITDVAYEYANGFDNRQYGIVVEADEVVILNKPQ